MKTIRASRAALVAGLFGAAFAVSAAHAQDYGYQPAAYEDSEIQVTAPRFHADSTHLNGPLEKVSLSTQVRYDDLDLRSWRGARALKLRVRDAAQDVCMRLAEAYPVKQQSGTNCYKTALQNASLRADAAIRDARDRSRYYYED